MADPQDENTFVRSKLNWDLQAADQHRLLWNFHQKLLRLRRHAPALSCLHKDTLEVTAFADSKAILLRRWHESSHIFAALHFAEQPRQIELPLPAAHWQKMLDSAESMLGWRRKPSS